MVLSERYFNNGKCMNCGEKVLKNTILCPHCHRNTGEVF